MFTIALVMAALVGIGFVAFPQFRPTITAIAPFALLALCPIFMIAMMFWTKSGEQRNTDNN